MVREQGGWDGDLENEQSLMTGRSSWGLAREAPSPERTSSSGLTRDPAWRGLGRVDKTNETLKGKREKKTMLKTHGNLTLPPL